jgi:hypothetical protein
MIIPHLYGLYGTLLYRQKLIKHHMKKMINWCEKPRWKVDVKIYANSTDAYYDDRDWGDYWRVYKLSSN